MKLNSCLETLFLSSKQVFLSTGKRVRIVACSNHTRYRCVAWILAWKNVEVLLKKKKAGQTLKISQCLHTDRVGHTHACKIYQWQRSVASRSQVWKHSNSFHLPHHVPDDRNRRTERSIAFGLFVSFMPVDRKPRHSGRTAQWSPVSSPKILYRLKLNHIVIPSSVSHLRNGSQALLLFLPILYAAQL